MRAPQLTAPKEKLMEQMKAHAELAQEETRIKAEESPSSLLFRGYRSIGYYASDLPLSVVRSDEDTLIVTAIGRHAFYAYDTKHLQLAYMSRHIPESIEWLQATPDGFVYTVLRDGGFD